MFLTDAILNGLPPHIGQVIAGHRDINVTLGYKAAYPDEAIRAHLAFLARRRALRPTEEDARIAEAEREGWAGEAEGLKISLADAEDKLTRIDRRTCTTTRLGIPATAQTLNNDSPP